MSCGKAHETPCSEVLADLYTYLDSECDECGRAKIRKHLEECNPCLREFGVEAEVKALVGRCCGQEVAPDGLRDRLRARLNEVVGVEVTESAVTSVEVTEGAVVTSVEVTRVEVTRVDTHRE